MGGKHYGGRARQHWDIVAEFQLDYFQGQITKYVMRWRDKGGLEDLEKARHFLDKYIELEHLKQRAASADKLSNSVGSAGPYSGLQGVYPAQD